MREEMQGGIEKEGVPQSMQELLQQMPLRPTRHLRQQEGLPLLCLPPNPRTQAQVSLSFN